jgi:hypothetical protein
LQTTPTEVNLGLMIARRNAESVPIAISQEMKDAVARIFARSLRRNVYEKDRTKGKENLCVPTEPGIFLGPNATGNPAARQGASLTGMIMKLPDGPETFLIAWGGFAWAPGGSPLSDYAVVTTDEIKDTNRGLPDNGLKYPLGLRGQWTQATGDLYGMGCGSQRSSVAQHWQGGGRSRLEFSVP